MPEVVVRELTFAQAIREALTEEMRRDPTVCIMGEDVAEAGTPFKVLAGLVEEFGKERVLDTPISEAGFTGMAVGAAMTGMRPIVDIMFGDFITLTMDQMANGKFRWSCARHSAQPADRQRSTLNRCTHGSATFPG